MKFLARTAVVGATALVIMGLAAGPAAAIVNGDCTGYVEIDGRRWNAHVASDGTRSNPVVVPDRDGVIVTYGGSVGFNNVDHNGEVGIEIGPVVIQIRPWGDPNQADDRSVDGKTYSLDEFRNDIPIKVAGIYKVVGEHHASGDCTGHMFVKIDGNPLTTPQGLLGAGISIGALVSLFFAGRIRTI